jgi:tetratricopeptide (TPR) repeat protein
MPRRESARAGRTTAVRRPPPARTAVSVEVNAAPAKVTAGRWLVALAVCLATVAVFVPVLQNQFVNWDDDVTLVDNPAFRGLGWPNLRFMFTTTLLGHWIPLTWMSFGIDYLIWGMRPIGYHLTSLLVHAGAAIVFFFVAVRLLGIRAIGEGPLRAGAAAAALFFAIHPLRVESVAWATERRDVLSGVFVLLTVLTYLRAVGGDSSRRRRWLAASEACYALALAAKAIAMTLPAVLIVLDIYPLRRLGPRWRDFTTRAARRVWREKVPYLILALAGALAAAYAQRGLAESLETRPLAGRIGVAVYGLGFYLWKTAIPMPLSPLYEIPPRVDPLAPAIVASAVAVGAITAALVYARAKWPAGLAAWVSYVVLLAPVSGLLQSGPQLVAARYSYLPCLGWAILIGAGVVRLFERATSRRRGAQLARAGIVASALCGLGLGALTWRQTHVWRDSETLWSHVAALDPRSSIAHNNLAALYVAQGRLDEAVTEARTALGLSPEWEDPRATLAVALARLGRLAEAGEERARLGYALLKHGRTDAALDLFRKEVGARPGDAAARNNLGVALLAKGDADRAIDQFEEALKIDPGYDRARRNLAAARRAR